MRAKDATVGRPFSITSPEQSLAVLIIGFLLVVGGVETAHAQNNGGAAATPAVEKDAATTPSQKKLSPEEIAELDACRALASSSKRLRGQVKNDLRAEIQQDDANMTMRNKKHVVMAYAALWILAVAFLVLLFLRQRNLLGEIARLQREVRAAVADEEQE